VKNGKGQKVKEEAKEIGFLKLDTSASNRPAERPPIARFLVSENGHFDWVKTWGLTQLTNMAVEHCRERDIDEPTQIPLAQAELEG